MTLSRRTWSAILLTLGLVWLLLASTAHADYEPIGSGATRLTLDKTFLAACKTDGVKLTAIAPARLAGGVLTVPAVGGKFDPVAAKGTVEGEGGLLLSAKGRKVPIKALQLRTTSKHSPFTAKVGGSQLKLATAKKISITRAGFDDKVSVSGLALSQTLATRLGKKLDLRNLFEAGTPLGKTQTTAVPTTISLTEKGAATLTLDPGLVAKLASLFVAVNPIFPAEHQGPVFTLPIFGGTISTTATLGRLETSGALEFLQLGAGQVFWREPWLEFESGSFTAEAETDPSPPYPGKEGRIGISPMVLSGAPVAEAKARTVTASFTLTLSESMAKTFEEAFAKPQGKSGVFHAGEAVGTVGFTGYGQ